MYTPIIIFTYNRLSHLKKLLISLAKNPECKKSKAYIFIDGPKDNKDKINTDKIFNYMNNIDLFRSKQIIYRSNNLGTARSIIKGINYVSNKEKKFIVLEEDLIVSNQFLYFCNNLLKLYKNEKNVWHINCWVFDNLKFDDAFFFSTHMSCWGWATWSDRWKNFKKIEKKFFYIDVKKNFKKKFDYLNSGSYLGLLLNFKRKTNTWAVYWYYTIFKNKGLTITPYKTLVINSGFDFKSTNTKINYYSKSKIQKKKINSKLKFKKPFLDINILEKINHLYMRKNIVLNISIKIKELLY
jgi:hypothetical protein